jgi:hypothetical protein
MPYETEEDLVKDCMDSAVQFKQLALKGWFSPKTGTIPNWENQKAVDILRSEIRTIRELFLHKFNEKMKVDLTPLESPNFSNYQQ